MRILLPSLFCLLLPLAAAGEPLVVTAVGDIMLAGSAAKTCRQQGYDYPFAATRTLLGSSDLVIGNLEAPLTLAGEEFTAKKFRFRGSPQTAAALKRAGFTHLSLANNHMLDFGVAGLDDTLAALDAAGLAHAGAGSDLTAARAAAVAEIKGQRLALLSYSLTQPQEFFAARDRAGTAPGYPQLVRDDIRRAKAAADYVIVAFHWGGEGEELARSRQRAVAHAAIDAGADIVIGHHPHVLQGIEYYREGVIFYSLGNFAFGSLSATARDSIIARITLDGGVAQVEIIPLNVANRTVAFQPRPHPEPRAAVAAGELARLSSGMNSTIAVTGGRYLVRRQAATVALQ